MEQKPTNSLITFDHLFGHPAIIIPQLQSDPSSSIFGVILFPWILFWLISLHPLLSALLNNPKDFVLILFTFSWILGGTFAMLSAYAYMRATTPEVFILAYPVMYYDSGVQTFDMKHSGMYRSGMIDKMLKQILKKRIKIMLDQEELKTLTLWKLESGNKLTILKNGRRLELAANVTDLEREWLFETLVEQYKLSPNIRI
jgi:hypothetical protein